ncbi:YpiF family protein [Alteribacter populi]|uniref:YpiF family protein n=1 Tax=Alteribacter populi TaxID=2011011 RepID=UPI000BBB5854|nr:YpiF family protein [Alteribacter populi]
MKWITNDVDMYLKSREYVDTAVIPLIPIDWDKDPKGAVSKGEFIGILIEEIEKQFKGRLFQIPPFTYLMNQPVEERMKRIKEWDRHFYENGFKHIVYLTSDAEWKQAESEFPDLLLWIPSLPLENVEPAYVKQMMEQQIKQILPIISDKWQSEPRDRE